MLVSQLLPVPRTLSWYVRVAVGVMVTRRREAAGTPSWEMTLSWLKGATHLLTITGNDTRAPNSASYDECFYKAEVFLILFQREFAALSYSL